MSKFKESNGAEWEVRFSVPVLSKVARKMGLTIQDLTSLRILLADMLDALPIVFEAQLRERGIKPDDFMERLNPHDLPALIQALGEAFREAFPSAVVQRADGGEGAKTPFVPGN